MENKNFYPNNLEGFYTHPQEVWNKARCEKQVKHTAKDGLGTPYPFKGYIGSNAYPGGYGVTKYNGGCIRNSKLYQGEIKPLPKVADGFEIIHVSSWGYRLIKSEATT